MIIKHLNIETEMPQNEEKDYSSEFFDVFCSIVRHAVSDSSLLEHILRLSSEQHCDHKYTAGQKELTHSHSVDANCHICHFAFSTFVPNSFPVFSFHKTLVEAASYKFFYFEGISAFFKGSLFALRAPPAFI
ncbi:hypothetical protein AAFH68_32740 [Flavobacterium sp. CGRL1]